MKIVYCVFVNVECDDSYYASYHNLKGIFYTRLNAERYRDSQLDIMRKENIGFEGLEIEEWEIQ